MDPATSAQQNEPQPGAAQRRIVLSFCATVLIGVLLCAGYLASGTGRAAAPAAAATSINQTSVAPATSKPPVSLPVAAPPRAAAIEPPARIEVKEKKPVAKETKAETVGATYLHIAAGDRVVAEVVL